MHTDIFPCLKLINIKDNLIILNEMRRKLKYVHNEADNENFSYQRTMEQTKTTYIFQIIQTLRKETSFQGIF